MQRMIAAALASLLLVPMPTAQEPAVNATRRTVKADDRTHSSHRILDSAIREAKSVIAAGDGLEQTRQQRSFANRHPVMIGALVGAGSGAAFGALLSSQSCADTSEPGLCSLEAFWLSTLVGTGVGAIIGRVISRQ